MTVIELHDWKYPGGDIAPCASVSVVFFLGARTSFASNAIFAESCRRYRLALDAKREITFFRCRRSAARQLKWTPDLGPGA